MTTLPLLRLAGGRLTRRANPMNWRTQAACAEVDQDLFYPPEALGKGSGRRFDGRPALTICQGCDVRPVCLAVALDEERAASDSHGVRGGLTAAQRLQIIRRRTGYRGSP